MGELAILNSLGNPEGAFAPGFSPGLFLSILSTGTDREFSKNKWAGNGRKAGDIVFLSIEEA